MGLSKKSTTKFDFYPTANAHDYDYDEKFMNMNKELSTVTVSSL